MNNNTTEAVSGCVVYLSQERGGLWSVAVDMHNAGGGASDHIASAAYDDALSYALALSSRLGCDVMIQDQGGPRLLTPHDAARRMKAQ